MKHGLTSRALIAVLILTACLCAAFASGFLIGVRETARIDWLALVTGMSVVVPLGTAAAATAYAIARFARAYRTKTISEPPGSRLDRCARFVFSKRAYCEVFGPCIADLQYEHFEALQDGFRWKARWVIVRSYGAFAVAVVAHLPLSLIRMVVTLWKAIG